MRYKICAFALIGTFFITSSALAELFRRDEMELILKYYSTEQIIISNSNEYKLLSTNLDFSDETQPLLQIEYKLVTSLTVPRAIDVASFVVEHQNKMSLSKIDSIVTNCTEDKKLYTLRHPIFGPIKMCASANTRNFVEIKPGKTPAHHHTIKNHLVKLVGGWAIFMLPDGQTGITVKVSNSPPEAFARFITSLAILRPDQLP